LSLLHAMLRHDERSGDTKVAGSSPLPADNAPAEADGEPPAEVGTSASVLYVATNLETWETRRPEPDQDAICEPCGFRRLDPAYYAWLRSRMVVARERYQVGRLRARRCRRRGESRADRKKTAVESRTMVAPEAVLSQ